MSKIHSFLSYSMRNIYTVDLPDGINLPFFIGKPNPDLDSLLRQHHASTYAYLTAYNPRSTTLSNEENQARQTELENLIREMNIEFLTGKSYPEAGEWDPEVCVFAFNMSRAVARDLCNRYEQDAAVVGDWGSSPKLFFTDPTLRQDFVTLIQNCVLE
jgi:hypothetical protein